LDQHSRGMSTDVELVLFCQRLPNLALTVLRIMANVPGDHTPYYAHWDKRIDDWLAAGGYTNPTMEQFLTWDVEGSNLD